MPFCRKRRNASNGLVSTLALFDQRPGHIFYAQPQSPEARLSHDRQMLFDCQGVMDRGFGSPADLAVRARSGRYVSRQGFGDVQCPLPVVEEVVIRTEEETDTVVVVDALHFVTDPLTALHAVLPLIIGGDRTIGAAKFASQGHNQRCNPTVFADLARRQRVWAQCSTVARRFQKPISQGWMRQLVQIAQKTLDSCIDQFLGHTRGAVSRIDQSRNGV